MAVLMWVALVLALGIGAFTRWRVIGAVGIAPISKPSTGTRYQSLATE